MKHRVVLLLVLALAACAHAPKKPPIASAASAPSLEGTAVVVFPVQDGAVPSPDSAAKHWPVDRAALDAEIGYWLKQAKPVSKWILPPAIDRALARSPGLEVNPRALAVSIFQRAQVKRIGDPLFGDIRKVAAVLNGQLAVIPVAAEYVGRAPESAAIQIAVAVIKLDADVAWFGVIAGPADGVGSQAAVAGAAQAFAQAFAPKKKPGDN